MIRVVDEMPNSEEMASAGLTERDFTVDRETYRHFAEQCRREYFDFRERFYRGDDAAGGTATPVGTGALFTGLDQACVEAFDRSRPPYCYRQGLIFRYRIDPAGTEERPILLERAETSEVSGSFAGIPLESEHRGLLVRLSLWLAGRLGKRKGRGDE